MGLQGSRLRGNRVQELGALRDALPLPHGGSPAGTTKRSLAGAGAAPPSFEFRAHTLVSLGHQVDEAAAAATAYEPARARLEEAIRRWREAVAQLPAGPTLNGELDAASANALLTGALARGDTGRHES